MTKQNNLLDDSLEALEQFYLINKLRFGIEKRYFHTTIIQGDNNILLEDWSNIKKSAAILNNELINLYLVLIEILENLAQNDFLIEILWQKIETTKSKISAFDLHFLSISLINCCNKLIVQGKKHYYETYLQIYLRGIEIGYLLENNQMPTATFKNVTLALAVRQDKVAFEDFLKKYKFFLKSDERNNAEFLARTYFCCHAKRFDDALGYLNQIQNAPTMTKYSCYLLYINIFMELLLINLDYADLINSKIAAFRQFIKRDETLSDDKKRAYHNYLLLVGNIFNHIYQQKTGSYKALKESIATTTPLVSREWLSEIVARL